MRGEGRIHTKGKKAGHCLVSQRLLSMIVDIKNSNADRNKTVNLCKLQIYQMRFLSAIASFLCFNLLFSVV